MSNANDVISNGLAIGYKRLEKGVVILPPTNENNCIIEHRQLAMLL